MRTFDRGINYLATVDISMDVHETINYYMIHLSITSEYTPQGIS